MPELLTPHRRVLLWGRSLFALVVVAVLLVLGVANIAMRAQSHRSKTACCGQARAEGVTAAEVTAGIRPPARAGIERGDVLLAVNGSPIERPADVVSPQHRGVAKARGSLTRSSAWALVRRSTCRSPRCRAAARCISCWRPSASSRCSSARRCGCGVRDDQATLHFFWLCVAFFGAFTFSFNGPFDRLDWVFYWGDAVAMALLPPLLLHFTLEFPERPPRSPIRAGRDFVPLVYIPALVLGAARVIVVTRGAARRTGVFPRDRSARSRRARLSVRRARWRRSACWCAPSGRLRRETGQRQLRWIAWGTALGVGPFALVLRAAVGARHGPAAGASADGDSARASCR